MIVVNDTGIYLSAGPGLASINLIGPLVDINLGALQVLGP
jgi:hypothetical protein